jgi:hypothetical protein
MSVRTILYGFRVPAVVLGVTLVACTSSVIGTGTENKGILPAPSGSGGTSSTSSGTSGVCPNIAGTWDLRGLCGTDICEITQNFCSITLSCDSGASATGSVVAGSIVYSGSRPDGTRTTCTGSGSATRVEGRCNPDKGISCTFTATRE